MDDRRKHTRAQSATTPTVVWLVLRDGTKQMGVIDDHGEGGACIELNGVVTTLSAGDVVGLETKASSPSGTGADTTIPAQGRIAWMTGRHLGVQFLDSN